jgi:hypothetical protein
MACPDWCILEGWCMVAGEGNCTAAGRCWESAVNK